MGQEGRLGNRNEGSQPLFLGILVSDELKDRLFYRLIAYIIAKIERITAL